MSEYRDGLRSYSEEDARDVRTAARVIAAPLHYTRGTRQCTAAPYSEPCDDCVHAARLVIQHYKQVLTERLIRRMVHAVSPGTYVGEWPRGSDD